MTANPAFYRTFHTAHEQTLGHLIYELGTGQWRIKKLQVLLEAIVSQSSKFDDYEVEVEIPMLGPRTFALNARRLEQPHGVGNLILLALEDVTPTSRRS